MPRLNGCDCNRCRVAVGLPEVQAEPPAVPDATDPYAVAIGAATLAESIQARAADTATEPESESDDTAERCSACGTTQSDEWHRPSDMSDDLVCQSCFDETYCRLESNGEIARQEDCTYLEGLRARPRDGWYADSECGECRECGSAAHMTRLYTFRGDHHSLCRACRDDESNNYVYVSDSSSYHRTDDDDIYYWESDGEYHYEPEPEHDSESDTDNSAVLSYGTNILSVLGNVCYVNKKEQDLHRNNALLLGVELEVDSKLDRRSPSDVFNVVREETDFTQYGIVQDDSTCTGGEYISLPADLCSHKERLNWPEYLKALRTVAKGFDGRDNGMHVHINRRAISPLTLGRMLVFMNAVDNSAFLTTIAQRPISECVDWCKMEYRKKLTDGARHKLSRDRYVILNVKDATVECRMFKSTLKLERFYKNLEFCDALVNWCASVGPSGLNTARFCDFVATRRGVYPHLHKFIRTRWYGLQCDIEGHVVVPDVKTMELTE